MAEQGKNIINVIQGEFRVSKRPEDVITTILGSCVSACIYDPVRRIGGMNHFLLPGTDPRERQNIKYGAYAMEQLINALLRGGAQRSSLEAKLFGGASVVRQLSDIGKNNAEFARAFLKDEGIHLAAHCLGGTQGRRIRFWPHTGRAQAMLMQATNDGPAVPSEIFKSQAIPLAPTAGEVDLF
ncbi:chemotaxis protein CheD [Pararhodobacter sp.]|uniref:chemotaxis protein CheD n=1 Tax=Pararhodobacter sp. TaxID=2127056 RepID=UPI002FDDEE77